MQLNLSIESINYASNKEQHSRILRIFEEIHNHIYANEGFSPEQCLDEVIKTLFLKIYDEQIGEHKDFYIDAIEYEQIIKGVSPKNFEIRIKNLEKNAFKHFSSLFEKNEVTKLKLSSIAFIVNKLQGLDLSDSSRDIKGLAFQKFLHSSQRAGRGQFFTPDQVIDLCVRILDPQPHEKILDPACGSGGFIGAALRHLHTKSNKKSHLEPKVFGLEINLRAARIAKMRIFLEGGDLTKILQSDSLSDWETIDLMCDKTAMSSYQEEFDVVITNPPFGSQGKINNQSQLANFQFGYKWDEVKINEDTKFVKTNEILNGQVPEILFIERCIDFLKPGGRMAIVLPNGDFENTTLRHLRYFVLEKCNLLGIIQLPQETFIPSGTGVKTSILLLTKKKKNEQSPKEIFFSQVTKLGYAGNKNGTPLYKKDFKGNYLIDANGNNVLDEDISDVISNFEKSKNNEKFQDDNSFLVNTNLVSFERFDYEFYRPEYDQLVKKIISKNGVPLSEIASLAKGKSSLLKKKDETVRYVELSDISNQYSEIINSTELSVHELPSRATYRIKKGQLITSVSGASIGTEKHASAYVTEEYDGCICTNGFRVIEVNQEKVDPFYLLAYFKSKYFLSQVMRFRTGAAIPSIIDSDLQRILVILPPLEEQQKIGQIVKNGFVDRTLYRKQLDENLKF